MGRSTHSVCLVKIRGCVFGRPEKYGRMDRVGQDYRESRKSPIRNLKVTKSYERKCIS